MIKIYYDCTDRIMYSAQSLHYVEKCAVCLGDICTETRGLMHVYGDTVALADFWVLDLSQMVIPLNP